MNEDMLKVFVDNKSARFIEKLQNIEEQFNIFYKELKNYYCSKLTPYSLTEIQYKLNKTLQLCNLDIRISVYNYDEEIIFIPDNFKDYIVWLYVTEKINIHD